MASELPILQACLRRVLLRWRLMLILRGLSVLAITGAILIILCLSAVHYLDPGSSVNFLLVAAALGGLVYLAYRHLFVPLRRTPSDLQVARYIEERHPDLNDALVSAVEYGDVRLRGPQKALLDQLLSRVSEFAEQIDFKRVVDRKRNYRLQAAAAAAALVLTALIVQDPGWFGSSVLRLVSWTGTGPASPGGIRVEPGDTRVRRGDSQAVTAILGRGLSMDPRLFVRFTRDEDWSVLDLHAADEEGTFTSSIHGIDEDGRYYVAVTGNRSKEFYITVFDPPFVERIDARYDFPAYTGLVPKLEEDRGDITAPVDTRIVLRITASKAISSAELRFSDGRSDDLAAAGKELEGTFVVREDLSYTIHLED